MTEKNKSPFGISPKNLSNLKVVVLCVAAATTFWILNALNKDDYTTIVDYPVFWEFDRELYAPIKLLPKSIEVEVSGNGWDLLRKYFNFNSPGFPIKLENPASRSFLLTSDLRRAISEFLSPTQLIGIGTDSLHFQIDPLVTLNLSPYLDSASFSLGKNIRLEAPPLFKPSLIPVKGPKSLLEQLEKKLPVQLDESDIDTSLEKPVPITFPEPLDAFLQSEVKEVTVTLEVITMLEGNKRIKIQLENFPETATLSEEEPMVMLYYLVDSRYTEELKNLALNVTLDYTKRNKNDSTISIQLATIPEYLDQVRLEPSFFKINYEK